jgi:hypothetical protein
VTDKPETVEAKPENLEFQQFGATVKKILSVSRKELQQREKKWQRKRAKKKERSESA